jgi:type I restriction-modification system DNA methylase subunit
MNHTVHNKNVSLIWSIADDCLRDIYVRGKYRDVILPMVVLRRLDSLLEPTKEKVLEEVAFQKEDMGLVELDENKNNAGIAAKVFENSDFGYYKVAIERPDRRKALISTDRTASLRFDKTLAEPIWFGKTGCCMS